MGKAYAWARAPSQSRTFILWISWVAVHILGALLALAVIPQIPILKANNTGTLLVSGIVCFFLVSILQDAILAYHVPGLRFGKWSALTVTAGVAAGFVSGSAPSLAPVSTTTNSGGALIAEVPSAIESVLMVTIIGAVIGLVIGAAQSLVLPESAARLGRKPSQRSVWVFSSGIAWFLGFGTIAWTVRFLDNHNANSINAYDIGAATMVLALVSGVTIVGAVTAIALMGLFRAFQDTIWTSSSQLTKAGTVGIGVLYGIAAIMGALFLWGSYTLAEESFLWPYGYSGPTYYGSPDEFFLMGRVLTSSMVAISAIYTLLFLTLSLNAFQKRNLPVEQHGTRYWAMILAASIVLVLFNLFAFLIWIYEYLD